MSNTKKHKNIEIIATDFDLENRQLLRLPERIRNLILYDFPVNLNLGNVLSYLQANRLAKTEKMIRDKINEMTAETWGEDHPGYKEKGA